MGSAKFIEAEKQHIQVIARIEAQENEPVAMVLNRLYINEGLSYNELKAHLSVSVARLIRLLKECGIAARSRSEVVKAGKAKTAPQRKAASVVAARIEQLEGESVAVALRRLYEKDGLTYRQLMKRWGIQANKVVQLMKECSIQPRERSEAVARQWVDNPARREAASLLLREEAKKQAAEGRHNNLGNTKNNAAPGRYDNFVAAGQTPTARAKQASQRVKCFAVNPSMHPNAKVAPTANEDLMLSFCRGIGFDVVHNQPVAGYWIDVYLPVLKVGIECVSVGRHPSWERHQTLVAQGIHMLYVMNTAIEKAELTYFTEYMLTLPNLQSRPDFRLRDAVVWGTRRVSFFPDTPDGMTAEVVSLKGSSCLRFSLSVAATLTA